MKTHKISVVIPSYNEMANLQKGVLEKVKNYLEEQKYDYDVIVVDDGSTDGSREFVKKFIKNNSSFRLIENNHTGKAGAVTKGMLAANGDFVLFTDMDQATPIEEIANIFPYFQKGYDVVIGSRSARKGAPFSRQLMSRSAAILRSLLIGLPEIKDTQCGFKMFTKQASDDLFTTVKKLNNGFKTIKGSAVTAGFDMELLYIAKKKGYKIKEVPVAWLYVETRRVNPVTDSIQGVIDLFRIRSKILRNHY